MAHEIVNSLRSKSLIRIVGNTATTIALSDLAKDNTETVTSAEISQVSSYTDGVWRIYRGDSTSGVLLLELPNNINLVFYEFDISLSNTATANIHITNSGTVGTMILQVAKTASYSIDTGKL